jgi:hypothetical protein
MARIEIASALERRGPSGRPLMSDHNLSARVWATAALIAVPAQSVFSIGWWLPVHLAMLGAASQAIVGGQLLFTTTLGLSRGPKRSRSLLQLSLLNIGAGFVVGGRVWDEQWLLAIGASVFVVTVGWVSVQVHLLWRRSINRRFAITGTFYRLAGLSILFGASIGGALGIGAFDDPSSYVAHRGVHMTLNLLGWAGLTIVGTAVTLLPTILHVHAPQLRMVRATPWLMFGGLAVLSAGATLTQNMISLVGYRLLRPRFGRLRAVPEAGHLDSASPESSHGRPSCTRGSGLVAGHDDGGCRVIRSWGRVVDTRCPRCGRRGWLRFSSPDRSVVFLASEYSTAAAAA